MPETLSNDIIISLSLVFLGGFIESIGYVLQKKAHNDCNHEETEGSDIWYAKRISWKAGITIFALGATLNALSLNFGPQCILIPLMYLSLIWITIFSSCFLKQSIITEDLLAIIIICFGGTMIIAFGPNTSTISGEITINELRGYYNNVFFIVFAGFVTIAIIFNIILIKYTEHKNYKSADNQHITFGAHFLLFSYCIIAAYFISAQQIFLKSLVSMIGSSIQSSENLKVNVTDYLTYLLILLYIAAMLIMELFRNRALAYFGALYVLPIFEVWSLILSTCLGAIYFQELQDTEPVQGTLFFMGIIIFSIGVIILAYDMGQVLENIADYIAVAFVDENKVGYHQTKGLVYGGWIPKLYQEWYFHHQTFLYNNEFESYFSLSTDDGNDRRHNDGYNEYDDSEDDLHIEDMHPL